MRLLLLIAVCWIGSFLPTQGEEALIYLDRAVLEAQRAAWQSGEPDAETKRIVNRAKKYLEEPIPLITEKPHLPVSGKVNDYYSIGIYWWPHPKTRLPYQRRDGEVNPEHREYDSPKLQALSRITHTLAQAWFITGEAPFAQRTREWLRTWLINPETRMAPHFDYAQSWPGWTNGSPTGIIEGATFALRVPDAILLLRENNGLPEQEWEPIHQWFTDLNRWLNQSTPGKYIDARRHNHANYYDVQRVAYALLCGETDTAKSILSEVGPRRIAPQIRPDGSMPAELKRTKAWDYSCYSLTALISLAEVGQKHGIDLWSYEAPDNGGSIRKALLYLLPFAKWETPWPFKAINGFHPASLAPLLKRAAPHYPQDALGETAETLRNTPAVPKPQATPDKQG